MDNLSGGTTNLLRMARSECRAAAAFVALALDDDMFATATYRAVPDDELFRSEAVDDLIRQAWADPEFGHGRALVRVARLGGRWLAAPKRTALAILPLIDGPGGRPWGLLGVAGPDSGSFDDAQLELLGRIAHRLSSYFRARQAVRQQMTGAPEPAPEPPVQARESQQTQPAPTQTAPPPAQAAQAAQAAQPSTGQPVTAQPAQTSAAGPHGAPTAAMPTAPAARGEEPGWSVSPPPTPPAPPPSAAAPGSQVANGVGTPTAPAPTPPAAPTPPRPSAGEWTAVLEPGPPEEGTAPELQWGRPGAPTPSIRWGQPPPVPGPAAPVEETPPRQPPWTEEPGWEAAWDTPSDWDQQGLAQDEELWWEAGTGADQPTRRTQTIAAEPPPAGPAAAPAQPRAPEPSFAPQGQQEPPPGRGGDVLGDILRGEDSVTGLLPLGALLGRTGRMLGAAMAGGGALAMVVIELAPEERLADDQLRAVARALRAELRFDDPVARIGPRAFAAVVPLVPGGSGGPGLEEHLVRTVRSAVPDAGVEVRAAHALASLDERHDADELLRAAISKLRTE